jgi:4-hydroxy-tetrahydrodipicolinate reductase
MKTKVAISGILGRMGKRILDLALQDKDIEVVGGLETEENAKKFPQIKGVKISANPYEIIENCDVLIEFSNSTSASLEHAKICVEKNKAIVIGTTGFNTEELKTLKELAKKGKILFSPNMSLGVNLLFKLVELATKVLKNKNFDIEILEIHHKHKKDAPSGTAMKLAEIIAKELNKDLEEIAVYGRKGEYIRKEKDLGIMTLRGGDVVGEHTVFFFGLGERLELTHRATSRDIFARGAIQAAKWIAQENIKPGKLYSMFDVLFS